MKDCSVILANLTAEDDRKLRAGRISYTGATGMAPRPNEPLAPYIATYLSNLPKALHVLGWKHITVTFAGEQWIVRRHFGDSGQPYGSEVGQLLRIAELCLEMAANLERPAPSA